MTTSLFAAKIRFEDTEGLDYPQGDLITEGDEGESVAAAVAEITEEEAGIAEDERANDQLLEDSEQLEEVQQAVEVEAPKTEHAGLTPSNARLLKLAARRILGKEFADRKLPRMESFISRADARSANGFVLEGIGEALKSFWETLKAQFTKIWARIKSWGIKTFSAAAKLSDRAKSIRDRAESSSSTIEKTKFSFSQIKTLAVGGALKEVGAFETSLNLVADIVTTTNDAKTTAALETLDTALNGINDVSSVEALNTSLSSVAGQAVGAFTALVGKANRSEIDPAIISANGGGEGGEADVKATPTLPGDKMLLVVQAAEGADALKKMRMARVVFANTKNKPKEISGDAEVTTLNPSQIAKFCNIIIDSADTIADYEKAWEKNDKAQSNVLKRVDALVKEFNSAQEDSGDSAKERTVREIARTTTEYVKRIGGLPAVVAGYAVPVYAATLNWCEGSMRNYKK